jgi:crotonobetainyl-CoA:carnitine CoA-transferase CaiB-like acyl-CoA transferase
MSLPLEGIKIIDFTGVPAGPACTQLLAWFGADVLKVERLNGGDVTRQQLRDIPDMDALYFTQLNSNKKSLAVNTKTPEGKQIMEQLIRKADVLVENFAPGAMDRMGFSWKHRYISRHIPPLYLPVCASQGGGPKHRAGPWFSLNLGKLHLLVTQLTARPHHPRARLPHSSPRRAGCTQTSPAQLPLAWRNVSTATWSA